MGTILESKAMLLLVDGKWHGCGCKDWDPTLDPDWLDETWTVNGPSLDAEMRSRFVDGKL